MGRHGYAGQDANASLSLRSARDSRLVMSAAPKFFPPHVHKCRGLTRALNESLKRTSDDRLSRAPPVSLCLNI